MQTGQKLFPQSMIPHTHTMYWLQYSMIPHTHTMYQLQDSVTISHNSHLYKVFLDLLDQEVPA
jgi:hypothetical protein